MRFLCGYSAEGNGWQPKDQQYLYPGRTETWKYRKGFGAFGKQLYVEGVVEHGRGIGHKVLFPTTNLVPQKEKLMPPAEFM